MQTRIVDNPTTRNPKLERIRVLQPSIHQPYGSPHSEPPNPHNPAKLWGNLQGEDVEGADAIEKAVDSIVSMFVAEKTAFATETEKRLLSKLECLLSATLDESRESLW